MLSLLKQNTMLKMTFDDILGILILIPSIFFIVKYYRKNIFSDRIL